MHRTLSALCMLMLGACSVLQNETQRSYQLTPGWDTSAAFTTADVRIITARVRPGMAGEIVCTEPSPDVAKAVAAMGALSAQGSNGTINAGINVSGGTSEALAELAGRTTALLGLRDGLYHACEAYANGAIGADAYSLVLSRYGQLMTTLFLGQDVVGATGGAGARGTESSPTITLPAVQQNSGTGNQSNAPSSSNSNSGTSNKSSSNQGVTNPLAPHVVLAAASTEEAGQPVMLASARPMSAPPAPSPKPAGGPVVLASGAAPGAAAGGPAAPGGGAADTSAANSSASAAASPGAASAAAALVLGRMNEDYFNLDTDLLHLLVVACVNEFDPTRLRMSAGPNPTTNTWLRDRCGQLDISTMRQWELAEQQSEQAAWKAGIHPINPEVAAVQSGSGQSKPTSPAKPSSKPDPVVLAVQKALQKADCAGCYPGPADGTPGPDTRDAIRSYQKAHPPLAVNGDPKDPATLQSLNVKPAAAGQ